MKKIIMLGLLSALVLAILVVKAIRSLHPRPLVAKPYTVEFTNKTTEFATGRVTEGRYILAVRSDGSTVRATLSAGPTRRTLVRHVQIRPERRVRFVADPIRSVSSQSTRLGQPSIPSDPSCRTHPNESGNRQYLGNEQFLGFAVAKSRMARVLRKEEGIAITIVSYEAPDLGCLTVKTIVETHQRGKVIGRTEDSASSIVTAEPDPSLFEVPVDYAEVPASALLMAMPRRPFDRDSLQAHLDQLLLADRRYFESRLAKSDTKEPGSPN